MYIVVFVRILQNIFSGFITLHRPLPWGTRKRGDTQPIEKVGIRRPRTALCPPGIEERMGRLAGDLHGLGPVLVVKSAGAGPVQGAVEAAHAAAVHGGDAGGGGGAGTAQTCHPSRWY